MKKSMAILLLFFCSMSLTACGDHNTPNPPIESPDSVGSLHKANTMVVYECNERLFANQNAFQAIQSYLPVLEQLHVNVLWLMPIHPRGEKNTCWSPYCVKDYKAIDPTFGTLEDLQSLVSECHQCGILVMLDWVANHTAWDHSWYVEHPEYYTEPVADETNWNDVRPLNYDKQEVCDLMEDALLYWVREADVDGFRCDYAHGVPLSFWRSAISELRAIKPNLVMLAETSKTEYYDAGFDWLYSWSYLSAIQNLYKGSKSLVSLYSTSASEYQSTPTSKDRLRYTTTHDASSENAPSTFYKSAQGQLSAFCLTAFLGGVPMVYSSQEIGDMGKVIFCAKTLDLKNFAADNATLQEYIRLMNAYQSTAEARYGEVIDYSTDKVAMFSRAQEQKAVLVIVNTSNVEQEVTLPMSWQRNRYVDALSGDSVWSPKTQKMGAYEYVIYSK